MLKREVREAWVREHPIVEAWLNRLTEGTRRRYMDYAYDYFNWLFENGGEFSGKSPEELLDLQEETSGRASYAQVRMLQSWVSQRDGRAGTKQSMLSAVLSFYKHNYVPLPKDPTFTVKGDLPSVVGSLAVEDLKKIILSSNTLYQAVFLCMFQGSMGEAGLEHFSRQGYEIQEQIREGKRRLRVDLPGRKRKKNVTPYFTFIGRDGVKTLRRYLEEERGTIRRGEHLFINEKGKPVSKEDIRKYWHRHAVEVGVIRQVTPPCPSCGGETRRYRSKKGGTHKVYYECNNCGVVTPASEVKMRRAGIRYGCNPHEMRDTFRSEWDLSPAKGVAAEFFMGHNIDPNMYNKIMRLHPEWAEEQYRLAEPYLNILSQEPRKVGVERVGELEETLETLKSQLREERTRRELYEQELKKLRARVNGLAETREPIHEAMDTLLEDPEVQRILLAKLKDLASGKH